MKPPTRGHADVLYSQLKPHERAAADKVAAAMAPLLPEQREQVVNGLSRNGWNEFLGMAEKRQALDSQIGQLENKIAQKLRDLKIDQNLRHASDLEGAMMVCADLQEMAEIEPFLKYLKAGYLKEAVPFARTWKQSGFAKMSCGHKLAAALMLTNVPKGTEVAAPWPAWSLYVPNGLLLTKNSREGLARIQEVAESEKRMNGAGIVVAKRPELWNVMAPRPDDTELVDSEVVRIWCIGSEPEFVVERNPRGFLVTESMFLYFKSSAMVDLIRNFVKGVCLTLDTSNLKQYEKPSTAHRGKSQRKPGAEPAPGVQYELGSPITIDLRDEVRRHLAASSAGGKHHSPPTVQFLVRGHWRDQPCGPGRVDNRRIWIQPFWKGPEEARVLLRTHSIKESVVLPEAGDVPAGAPLRR